MTKISIIKSSSDIYNKEPLPVSVSSYKNVHNSSGSDNEEQEKIDTDDKNSSDSDMLEILSCLVCNFWEKRKLHINTDFSVTGWMLCVINHICKYEKDY